jgi:hypothetical protein
MNAGRTERSRLVVRLAMPSASTNPTLLRVRSRIDTANGAEGDRTLNLRIANAALSQLSYRPI